MASSDQFNFDMGQFGETNKVTSSLEAGEGQKSQAVQGTAAEPAGQPEIRRVRGRVRDKDVLCMMEQMSIMFETGLNLMVALDCMAVQARSPALRSVVEQMRDSIRGGSPLWQAMNSHPKVFSPICVNMVRAGEIAGCMDEMLPRLTEYLEREIDTRSRVKSAISYPIVMLVMAVFVVGFLIIYVFPKFVPLFEGNEHLLPFSTKLFLWVGTTCQEKWPFIVGGIVALAVGGYFFMKQERVKMAMDCLWLKVPLLGDVVAKLSLSRSFHSIAVLLHGGIPILEALRVAQDVAGNHVFKESWKEVSEELQNGREFTAPLRNNPHIPLSEVQMMSMGERSGHLSMVLSKISKHYEKEIDYSVKGLVKFVEPALIICLGVLVGLIVTSLILPIFQLSHCQG